MLAVAWDILGSLTSGTTWIFTLFSLPSSSGNVTSHFSSLFERQVYLAMPAVLLVSKMSSKSYTDIPAQEDLKMAGSEEVEVDDNAVLNDRKEVKIAFQRERKRELFYQSC